jgi:hypothetical protein
MKAIYGLSVSLVILILLLFFLNSQESERKKPIRDNGPVVVESIKKASNNNFPSVHDSAIEKNLDQVEKEQEGQILLDAGRFISVDFKLMVVNEDGPITGAWAFARMRRYDVEGIPIPDSMDFRMNVNDRKTDENGIINCTTDYPVGIEGDQLFEVYAYEPQLGLGFRLFTLKELSKFGPEDLSINLEKGESVVGKVIDESGAPVEGAKIKVYMESMSEVNLSGLCALTKEDGSFIVSGVTLENKPVIIVASYDNRTMVISNPSAPVSAMNPVLLSGRIVSNQKAVEKQYFDESAGQWNVGEILISMSADESSRFPVQQTEETPEEDSDGR